MSSPKQEIALMLERIEAYAQTAIELTKLKSIKTASEVLASMSTNGLVMLLLAQFLLFLNIGLSIWIGELLDKVYLGFIIVSAFYLFIGLIVHFLLGKKIKKLISEQIITQALH